MKRAHLPWPKKEQAIKEINLQDLYDVYWTSKAHELVLQGQSSSKPVHSYHISQRSAEVVAVGNHHVSLELQFSAEVTVRPLATAHPNRLMILT